MSKPALDEHNKLALKAMRQARNFPANTCSGSRHAAQIAEQLIRHKSYPMLSEDPQHCGESIAHTVAALWLARTELAALADVADAGRVLAWAQETPRRPANAAFTAGPERQAAYWIEWSESKERERLAQLLADLRQLAERCEWPDGDGAQVIAQMWAEEWVRRIDGHNVADKRPACGGSA